MSSRFYFYTMDGKEIETNFNQTGFSSGGACIAIQENGKWIKKMYKTFKGELFARTEIATFINYQYDERKITIKDFPDHESVIVKLWCANPDATEWFVLTTKKENEEHASKVPMFS